MRKVIIVLCLLLLLDGCKRTKQITIKLTGNEVEYGEELNACRLIAAIDEAPVTEDMFIDGKLMYQKNEVQCNTINTKIFGDQQLEITFQGMTYRFLVVVLKTKGPLIETTAEEYDVYQDENFEWETVVTLTDVYDPQPMFTIDNPIDYSKIGSQTIRILAWDSWDNISTKTVVVNVKEREVLAEPKDPNKPGSSSGGKKPGSSGTKPEPKPNPDPNNPGGGGSAVTPKITGVKDRTLPVGSSVSKLQSTLSSGVSLNVKGEIYINYSKVNLSVPGNYTVYYTTNVGVSATCTVTIIAD